MGLAEPVRKTLCGNSANPLGFGFFRLNSCGFDKLRLDLRGQLTERCTYIIPPQRRFYTVPACAHAGVCPLEDVFCRGEQHIWVTWRCQLTVRRAQSCTTTKIGSIKMFHSVVRKSTTCFFVRGLSSLLFRCASCIHTFVGTPVRCFWLLRRSLQLQPPQLH